MEVMSVPLKAEFAGSRVWINIVSLADTLICPEDAPQAHLWTGIRGFQKLSDLSPVLAHRLADLREPGSVLRVILRPW
jgi:hypothetical protein